MSAIEDGAMQDKAGAQVDELVKRLRKVAPHGSYCAGPDVMAAANALESKSAELTRLFERNAELERELADAKFKTRELEDHIEKFVFDRQSFLDRAKAAETDCDSLRAKLDRAKEALLPFSEAEPQLDEDFRDVSDIWEHSSAMSITGGDIRRAHAVIAELSADAPARPRVRHKKRGSTYRVLGRGELQSSSPIEEGAVLVVYQCEADGRLWLRPAAEFDDGRFETLSDAPAQQTSGVESRLTVLELALNAIEGMEVANNSLKLIAKEAQNFSAPAQQTQISDAVREAMVEAEKALEPFATASIDGIYEFPKEAFRLAKAAHAKLRSVMK